MGISSRRVSTGGLRNEQPLTPEQVQIATDYAIQLGVPKAAIRISDAMNTSYKVVFGIETLYIGTDVLPPHQTISRLKANSKIGMLAALAHEIVGHRAAELRGETQEDELLEEVQASIRAARFAPDLPLTERILLLRDSVERLSKYGIKLRDVRHKLWID